MANPNCVLTARGAVAYPPGTVSIQVLIHDAAGNDAGATPWSAVTEPRAQTVPILELAASTTYTFVAAGAFADGGVLQSGPASLTTGALPTGVPTYQTTGFGPDGGIPDVIGPYTLIAPIGENAGRGTQYVAVVNPQGQPVWYLALPPGGANEGDCQKQPDGTYTVATVDPMQIILSVGGSPAAYLQYDVLGNLLATWQSPDEINTDIHELRLLADGTALLYGEQAERADLAEPTPEGGAYFDGGGAADAGVVGCALERIAPDGGVLLEWSAFALPLTDLDPGISFISSPIDAYHCNDIDVFADGGYLLGLRDMSLYLRLAPSGQVDWILGGPQSDFTFVGDPEGGFTLQHGGRILANGDLLIFDDGNDHVPHYSRAVEYRLDFGGLPDGGNAATLVWSSEADDPHLSAILLGFAQRLSNGDTLVTYGTAKHVQEVAPDAGLLWDLHDTSAADLGIYRAYRIDSLY